MRLPHSVRIYTASQGITSESAAVVPAFTYAVDLACQITPKSFDTAFKEYGVELNRPHKLITTLANATYLQVGNRVLIRDSSGVSEVVTLTVTAATGGTFTLTYEWQTTGTIAYNASAATVQTALRALTRIGATGVTCAGGALGTASVTCTFAGSLASKNVWDMVGTSSLTGTGATLTVTTNLTDRVFTIMSAPKKHNAGGSADHTSVMLEELEYGS